MRVGEEDLELLISRDFIMTMEELHMAYIK